jgi:hypothetical protein
MVDSWVAMMAVSLDAKMVDSWVAKMVAMTVHMKVVPWVDAKDSLMALK